MILRKINASLALLSTLLLLDHSSFHAIWMITGRSIPKSAGGLTFVLVLAVAFHAAISIALALLGHKGADKVPCKEYAGLNLSTMIQRMSGILLILLITLHVAGTVGGVYPPKIITAIVLPLFFTTAFAHASVSASKAFVTLGIGSAGFIKVTDIVLKVICLAILIADITGVCLYLF